MNKILSLLVFLLFLQGTEVLYAQESLTSSGKVTPGVRFGGGVQYAIGAGEGNGLTAVQPLGGAGLYLNVTSLFRIGLDYNYTRMVREQSNATLSQLPGGGVSGEVYRDLKTHFHGINLTGEIQLLPAGPVSFYAGTGAGVLLADGNLYTIGIKNEVKPDGAGNSIEIKGHNEGHRYVAPYVPLTFSLEYTFLPQVAMCLGAGYRVVIDGKNVFSPDGQAFATLGLRFDLK